MNQYPMPPLRRAARRRLLSLILLTWVGSLSGAAFGATAPEVTFRFNPPNGTTFVETVKTTRVKELGASAKQTDETLAKTRVTVKKTPDGYEIVGKPISYTMTRDGTPVNNPVLAALQEIVVIYEVDRQGQLRAIKGYDEAIKKIRASLPASVAASLSSLLSEEAMVNRAAAEWDGRISSFVGRRGRIGENGATTSQFDLPAGGAVTFYTATTLAEALKVGGRDCVRIRFAYNTDPAALQQTLGKTLDELAKAIGDAAGKVPTVSGVEIVGSGERVIDPATMLIYSESLTRTIKMRMESPGQEAVWTTMQEKREYSFTYAPPPPPPAKRAKKRA